MHMIYLLWAFANRFAAVGADCKLESSVLVLLDG